MNNNVSFIPQVAETASAVSTTYDYTKDTIDNQISKLTRVSSFYIGKYFQHNLLRDFLLKHFTIIRLNGVVHIYNKGTFSNDSELLEYLIQKTGNRVKPADIKLVLNGLHTATKTSTFNDSPCEYIGFNNCVIDIRSLKPVTFNRPTDCILTNKLAIDYVDPMTVENSADVELIDEVINIISNWNPELKDLLLQVIADCCVRGNLEPLAFILSGSGDNDGRNVFVNIIKAILGDSTSHEGLESIATGKSSVALYAKTCNISNEQEQPNVKNMKLLSDLISGNKVTDKKSGLEFRPFTTMIFNVPDLLNLDKCFLGISGYFKVIPFENKLTLDRTQLDKLLTTTNLQYITFKALQAYSQRLNSVDKKFTIPDVVENATNQYMLYTNSAKEFLLSEPMFHIVEKEPLYNKYEKWCTLNNRNCVCKELFSKAVYDTFKCESAKISDGMGNRRHYYVEKNFNVENLREQYLDYMLDKANYTEISGEKYANGKFIKAFSDYFLDHKIEDEDSNEDMKTPLERINDGSLDLEDVLKDLPNVM